MQIARDGELPLSSDFEQIKRTLPLEGARLLELGCGAAYTTRRLAESFPLREIVAMEVDRIQHEKNLLIPDLPNVQFQFGMALRPRPSGWRPRSPCRLPATARAGSCWMTPPPRWARGGDRPIRAR